MTGRQDDWTSESLTRICLDADQLRVFVDEGIHTSELYEDM
jgi:hypothetical protein